MGPWNILLVYSRFSTISDSGKGIESTARFLRSHKYILYEEVISSGCSIAIGYDQHHGTMSIFRI